MLEQENAVEIDYSHHEPAWNFDNPVVRMKIQREIVAEMVRENIRLEWVKEFATDFFAEVSKIIATDRNFEMFVDAKDWPGAKQYIINQFPAEAFTTSTK